jgi:hypothetical protein
VPGSVPPVGWESSPPASAGSPPDNQHQQCTFSQIFALAAGEHTITLQQAAALNANTITFYDRSLVVEQLA